MIAEAITALSTPQDPQVSARIPKKELGQDDFFQLLVTQLKHQDPMNPVADTEFIAQMAQFTSLEQTKGMKEDLGEMRRQTQFQQAIGLIGKDVTLQPDDSTVVKGKVTGLEIKEGVPGIIVNGKLYQLEDVQNVQQAITEATE
ncbi:MAG: flagellar hook capping FlgD N-terminal domain-containing protein [Verrucomicrobiota bacterium]|nr:flagellar hook capping FlgD N-terminal domain-containing protein [Verrucomicrobiota bacterium]